MQHIDYIEAQAQLAKTMRLVCESEQAITIDGAGKHRVVMLPLEVFQQLNANSKCVTSEQKNACGASKEG